jgi:hypothetical protein
MPFSIINTRSSRYNDRIYSLRQRNRALVRPQLLFFSPVGRSTFTFPFAPREISYSRLANSYNEIDRPGNFPILERSAPQLMQVSMQFRVADPVSNGMAPIEKRLDMLRGMALFPGQVLVSNMDSFLSRPSFPTVEWLGVKWAWFRITDLGIDVVNRNLSNRATQANVSMTLTEERNPWVPAIALPRITYEESPQRVSAAGQAPRAASGGNNPPPAPPAALQGRLLLDGDDNRLVGSAGRILR